MRTRLTAALRIASCAAMMVGAACGAVRERSRGGSATPAAGALAVPPPPLTEVGRFEIGGAPRCWATLFTPVHAVTAAHCLTPGMTEVTPIDAVLALERDGAFHRFPIDRVRAVGGLDAAAPGAALNADVALLHLARSVPPELATPRPLARVGVSAGDEVTFVGADRSGRGAVPIRTWRFDPAFQERVMRPGDSGGPLVVGAPGALGAIAGVGSAYATTPCGAASPDRMLFGDVARRRSAIERTMAGWDEEAHARAP